MLKLSSFLNQEIIVIQCHDNPDADSIASGYALYEYFKAHGKNTRLVYSGRFAINKPNLVKMVQELQIPIEYIQEEKINGMLITVDCQYGAGNVRKQEAELVVIIDHHQPEIKGIEHSDIRPCLGSCSTLVWNLITQENFDLSAYPHVGTALYYGLFSDTNSFTEIQHPLDKDMRDSIGYDNNLFRQLKNSNLSRQDIEIAGIALQKYSHSHSGRYAVFQAEPCDPNILGFISDIALQVEDIDTCVVYNEIGDGIKFSVRSCIREVAASELASFLADGIGSGGGHIEKAGGFISLLKFKERYLDKNINSYLFDGVAEYYESFDVVYSNCHTLDITTMASYRKNNIIVGFVPTTDIFTEGSFLTVRTLEGDIETTAHEDIFIMVGIKGEVYPIRREKFEKSYAVIDSPFVCEGEYVPSVRNRISGESVKLSSYMQSCRSTGEVEIYAQPLRKKTKVFTSWDPNKYMAGKEGDYIAIRHDDVHDVYIIEKNIFKITHSLLK